MPGVTNGFATDASRHSEPDFWSITPGSEARGSHFGGVSAFRRRFPFPLQLSFPLLLLSCLSFPLLSGCLFCGSLFLLLLLFQLSLLFRFSLHPLLIQANQTLLLQ